MDTKWKKSKTAAGAAAFCLSWGLLLAVLAAAPGNLSILKEEGLAALTAQDYQKTRQFREWISGRLENYLSMATGGPVNQTVWYGGSQAFYPGGYLGYAAEVTAVYAEEATSVSTEIYEDETVVVEEETPAAYGHSGEEGQTPEGIYQYGGQPSADPDTAALYRRQAEQFHADSKEDKNLLYIIEYDGETVYTNAEGAGLTGGSSPSAPEGYNFLLTFDGEKVKIIKDGKETDVYGDGYYEEGDDWYVPGYRNFTADERASRARITLAAARTPLLYIKANYSGDGFTQSYSPLYWMAQNLAMARRQLAGWMGYGAAGLALLLPAFLLGRQRRQWFDKAGAAISRLWLEARLILACLALAALFSACMAAVTIFPGHRTALWAAGLALAVFLIRLTVSSLCHGRGAGQNSLTARLWRLFQTRQLKLTAEKQTLRRYALLLVLQLLQAGVLAAGLIDLASLLYLSDMFWLPAALFLAAAMAALTIRAAVKSRKNAVSLDRLTSQIAAIRTGELENLPALPPGSPLAEASENLNAIREGLHTALEEQMKSERMKVELVSNVSHDIKTPLTSIISYVDLLNQEKDLPDYIQDYIRILDSKSQRLKAMVQDVFEISKAASGQLPVEIKEIDLAKLLRQTLADMGEAIEASSLLLKTALPEEPVKIQADGQRLYRVFQNLIQNALQYSLEGSRIYLSLTVKENTAAAVIKNISRSELPADIDFTERFTRGDNSRTDGGSGLGLSIARSFTEACGGTFQVHTDADLFAVTVIFPLSGQKSAPKE